MKYEKNAPNIHVYHIDADGNAACSAGYASTAYSDSDFAACSACHCSLLPLDSYSGFLLILILLILLILILLCIVTYTISKIALL